MKTAIGKRLRFSPELPAFTIIGVVADVKMAERWSRPHVWRRPSPIGSRRKPASWSSSSRQRTPPRSPRRCDRPSRRSTATSPISNVEPLADIVRDSIDQPRFVMSLAAAFALVALALAAIGIYGVMAYAVTQRTTEFGVRMALGAARREVFRLVLTDALKLTAAGVVVGIGGSLVISRSLGALQYGIRSADPVTLTVTSVALVLVAVVASVIPARRAMRVDPIEALRAESRRPIMSRNRTPVHRV